MEFSPEKLKVDFIEPATTIYPIEGRKYTLTHSDITAEMFLDVGTEYNFSAINPDFRDDVLGRWLLLEDSSYMLFFYANAEAENYSLAEKKYSIYKSHMNSALMAIFYGDIEFLKKYPYLVDTPIYVKFDSNFPMFDKYEPYGYVKNYLL